MPRGGPRPNSGGKRPGSGRKLGTPNRSTAEVRALAQVYGPAAIRKLAVMAGVVPKSQLKKDEKPAENETVGRQALVDLLARAYGHPTQPMEHSLDESWEAVLDRVGRLPAA